MYRTIWQRDPMQRGICFFRLVATAVSAVFGQCQQCGEDHLSVFAGKNVEEHRQRFRH